MPGLNENGKKKQNLGQWVQQKRERESTGKNKEARTSPQGPPGVDMGGWEGCLV